MQLSRQEYWNGLPFPSPGRSSRSRDWTCVFCISYIGRWILYHCATWEALLIHFLNYECLSHFPLHYSFSHLKNGMIIIMPQPTGLLCIKMLSYSPQLGFLEAEPGRGFLKTWFIRGMVSGKAQVEGWGCVEEHRGGRERKSWKDVVLAVDLTCSLGDLWSMNCIIFQQEGWLSVTQTSQESLVAGCSERYLTSQANNFYLAKDKKRAARL